MAQFGLGITAHSVFPVQGSDTFFNQVDGRRFTDIVGHRRLSDVRYNGKPGLAPHSFYFPFTTPFSFIDGPSTGNGAMFLTRVGVTFFTDPGVRVDRIRVIDRIGTVLFDVGSLGMSGDPTWRSFVFGRNQFDVGRVVVQRGLVVVATVDFGAGGGIVGFTGAALLLTN